MSEQLLYEIKALTFTHKSGFTLSVPHLKIRKGDSVGIMGPNGSGKTTLLRVLAFLEPWYRGTLHFKGQKVDRRRNSCRRRVTLLQQDPYLLTRSVFENVAYGLKAQGMRENLKKRVFDALDLVGLSASSFSYRRPGELSGGEARRVALASRLVLGSDVLILDEPTADVDRESAQMIKRAMVKQEQGTSLIIASHDLVWLKDVTNIILRMEGGRIVGRGIDNVIQGPWTLLKENLWKRSLPDGQLLYGYNPPHQNSVAILSPTSIMISMHKPALISAQNILKGKIVRMTEEGDSGGVLLEVEVSGIELLCLVTHKAAESLRLLPGKKVWLLFKATSLRWQ